MRKARFRQRVDETASEPVCLFQYGSRKPLPSPQHLDAKEVSIGVEIHDQGSTRVLLLVFPPPYRKSPANRDLVEAAGIEPASAVAPNRASTSVVRA